MSILSPIYSIDLCEKCVSIPFMKRYKIPFMVLAELAVKKVASYRDLTVRVNAKFQRTRVDKSVGFEAAVFHRRLCEKARNNIMATKKTTY